MRLVRSLLLVPAVTAAAIVALSACGGDSSDSPPESALPTPTPVVEPGLDAWCAQYPAAVVNIQTFGTLPTKDGADALIKEVGEWARVAPPDVAAQTALIAGEYTELGEAALTGDQQAVTDQATAMAADPALQQAVTDVSKFYSTNCPDGVEAPKQ